MLKLLNIKNLKFISAFLDQFKLGRLFFHEVINYMTNKEKKIIHYDVSMGLSVPTKREKKSLNHLLLGLI